MLCQIILWRFFFRLRNKRVFNYFQTSVLFFISRGILSGYSSLLALHLSRTPSLKTGTGPPSCLLLNNRLYMSPDSLMKLYIFLFLGPSEVQEFLCCPIIFQTKCKMWCNNQFLPRHSQTNQHSKSICSTTKHFKHSKYCYIYTEH